MSENNVKSKDLHLINDLNAALQKEKHSGQFWVIILFFLLLVVFVVWAYNSTVEEVTRGNGNHRPPESRSLRRQTHVPQQRQPRTPPPRNRRI